MMANCTTASGRLHSPPESRRRSAGLGDVFGRAAEADGNFQIRKLRAYFHAEIARVDDSGGCDDEDTSGVKISFIDQFNQLTDYEFRRVRCASKPCCSSITRASPKRAHRVPLAPTGNRRARPEPGGVAANTGQPFCRQGVGIQMLGDSRS
jgi:hypothetical protein